MQRDLAISCEDLDCRRLLVDWQWIVPVDATPLMIGIFGDWIFGAPNGSHWHLDLLEGRFRQITKGSKEFNKKKRKDKYLDEWFGADWASIALQNGLIPSHDECLGWKVLPILGGPFSLENIDVYPLAAYQSINGQVFRQLSQK